MFVQQSIHK